MRSKPKARKVTNDELDDAGLSAELDAYEEAVERYGSHLVDAEDDDQDDGRLVMADVGPEPEVTDDDDAHPVYIPEDIHIPGGFELGESGVFAGLGVWTLEAVTDGHRFGPFEGKMRTTVENPTSAWELVDDNGKVKGWIDASQPGTGNWLKYVRSTADATRQNLMAVQVQDEVFYKAVRDIPPREELLLYEQDAAFPEQEATNNTTVSTVSTQHERQFPCERCGDVFRSKVALRRHETYVCNNKNAIFTTINRNFRLQQRPQRAYSELQKARSELEKVLLQQQVPPPHAEEEDEDDEDEEEEEDEGEGDGGSLPAKLKTAQEEGFGGVANQVVQQPLDLHATIRHKLQTRVVLKTLEEPPRDDTSSLSTTRKQQDTTNIMNSGQSEEMIQTGAAEDRSALGSPSSLDHDSDQPYSIIDSVTGLRTFPCENCDKQFTDPSNLQRHIRSQHVGARSHACSECGKTFATSSGLKQHQHIHSSVKPFQCEVCLKAYTQFSNLCRHKRMHADCRQQIKCKDCGQAFSTMTSLSKHKRFCEGMLRPNGQQRIAYPGLPGHNAAGEKAQLGSLMNAAAQSPTSALASYMSLYQQPHRPPFPFYPPAFAGSAGFPLFPGSHPMAASLASSLAREGGGKLGSLVEPGAKSPGSPGNLHGQTGEMKRENNASEGSEADSSDVSSASDLDTSTGSDVDSVYHHSHHRRMRLHPGSGGVQVVNSHTRLAKSPLSASTPPAAHTTPTPRVETPRSVTDEHHDNDDEDDVPFDLSKSSSSPSTPVSFSTSSGDQPLDLSVRSKGSDSSANTPKTTPRKTHIFGDRGSAKRDGGSDGKRTPTSSTTTRPASSSSPDMPPSPVSASTSASSVTSGERALHYAYPTMASPVVIEPMYRVDKEKPQSYHDVVARMMAYGPPRMPPMHHQGLSFAGMQGGMGGLLSPARPDAAKLLPPMLGKTPDHHFAYHHGNSVNKLKERYACKFCGKIFPRSANLTRHLRTHTGEQPYKCRYCERSFSISSNLQRHVRNIHNKEKPFKCPLCDRCFGQQTNLDRHLKKHESDDPNMLDSPLPHEQELEEKDESYFDEIRNFIGKATAEGDDGTAVNGNGRAEQSEGIPIKSELRDGIIDSHFSLTGQVVEKHSLSEKRPAPDDDEDDDDIMDDDHSSSSGGDGGCNSPSFKKSRLENNNISVDLSKTAATVTPTAATDGSSNPRLGNGFHEDEDELEEELEDEEDLDEDEPVSLNGHNDSATAPQLNGVKAPMACSS